MAIPTDYVRLFQEAGFTYFDDCKECDHYFMVPFVALPEFVDVIRLFLLKDIENQPYRNGWIDGFRYGNSLTKIEGIPHVN